MLVLLIVIYIFTHLYAIIYFYLVYRRYLKRENIPAMGARDQALAETVTHVPPISGETLEALVADYSYASFSEGAGAESVNEGAGEELEDRYINIGRFAFDKELWRYIMRSAWPLAVVSAGVAAYAVLDVPILSWIRGDGEVGFYSAAGLFTKAFVFLTLAINMAVLPAVSRVGGKFPEKLGDLWERLMRYMLVLVAPLTVITPLLARPLLLIQKNNFVTAWPVTWITMAAMNLTFMTAVCFPFFIVINKQKTLTSIVMIGLVIKAVLCVIMVAIWGYMGAAITGIVSEFLIFILIYRALARDLGHRFSLTRFLAAPAASLGVLYATAIVLYETLVSGQLASQKVLGSMVYSLIISAAVLIIYVVLAYATKLMRKQGLNELNELLKVD